MMNLPVLLRRVLFIVSLISAVLSIHNKQDCSSHNFKPKDCQDWHYCEMGNGRCLPCTVCGQHDHIYDHGNCHPPTMCTSGKNRIACPRLQKIHPETVIHGNHDTFLGESVHIECNRTDKADKIHRVSEELKCSAKYDNNTQQYIAYWKGKPVCVTEGLVIPIAGADDAPVKGEPSRAGYILGITIPIVAAAIITTILIFKRKELRRLLKTCRKLNSDVERSRDDPMNGLNIARRPSATERGTTEDENRMFPAENDLYDSNHTTDVNGHNHSSRKHINEKTYGAHNDRSNQANIREPEENDWTSGTLSCSIEGNSLKISLPGQLHHTFNHVQSILITSSQNNYEPIPYIEAIQETSGPGIHNQPIVNHTLFLQRQCDGHAPNRSSKEDQSLTRVKEVDSGESLQKTGRITMQHPSDDISIDSITYGAQKFTGSHEEDIAMESDKTSLTAETAVKTVASYEHSENQNSEDSLPTKNGRFSSTTDVKLRITEPTDDECHCRLLGSHSQNSINWGDPHSTLYLLGRCEIQSDESNHESYRVHSFIQESNIQPERRSSSLVTDSDDTPGTCLLGQRSADSSDNMPCSERDESPNPNQENHYARVEHDKEPVENSWDFSESEHPS